MSGLTSLAGYGSDSDDDEVPSPPIAASTSTALPTTSQNAVPSSSRLTSLLPPPKTGLTSKLPPPSSRSGGSGLSLPPPSSSTKRKVIKVDSLHTLNDGEDGQELDEDARPKKPKLGSGAAGSGSKHSLFGMLPAPKRKDDEVLAERRKEAEARKAEKAMQEADMPAMTQAPLRIDEGAGRSASPNAEEAAAVEGEESSASGSKAKGKNNDAFRAMLGLKPVAKKPATASTAPAGPASSSVSTGLQKSNALQPTKTQRAESSRSVQAAALAEISTKSSKVEPAPVDFFSLSSARPINGPSSSSSAHKSSQPISAAPLINHPQPPSSPSPPHSPNDDASEYPGWQLDPDGSWIPITPEAHAQLLSHQATLTPHPTSKSSSTLDGTRDLLAAGLTPDDILSFDASTAARSAYHSGTGEEGDSEEYAAAADFAAGNRDAMTQQRKPGMLKGLRKGQLSSLVSLAGENRKKLEERWQRGRDGQAKRASRYGW